MMHLALFQPQIPPNTGNVARQCVGMNAVLHIIGPHTFDLSDSAARRAGLDYWPYLKLVEHATPEAFLDWLDGREPWLVTKYATLRYDQADYRTGDVIVLGNELRGLPEEWHARWPHRRVRIPILGPVRSYNLANSAAIVLAQAYSTAGLFEETQVQSAT